MAADSSLYFCMGTIFCRRIGVKKVDHVVFLVMRYGIVYAAFTTEKAAKKDIKLRLNLEEFEVIPINVWR